MYALIYSNKTYTKVPFWKKKKNKKNKKLWYLFFLIFLEKQVVDGQYYLTL